MIQLTRIKPIVCNYIIIREWIENGEFDNTNNIIVVGTRFQSVMVNVLFKRRDKRIFYCTNINYKHYDKTKWIIFDKTVKKAFPQNDYSILHMPII